ncbi:MAG: hypothetical protein M3545_18455, partial [Acidobacteriota bacterium]|nr:hypothetical protein [Acidobacteriota bacterium]
PRAVAGVRASDPRLDEQLLPAALAAQDDAVGKDGKAGRLDVGSRRWRPRGGRQQQDDGAREERAPQNSSSIG